jgi:ribosomal peptide maturation radical SAM protein 1
MPFGALERPPLSLGLLKAHCGRLDVPCDVRHLTFRFADLVGLEDYQWACSDDVPYTAFAGEWLFAEALHGPRPEADAAYLDEVLRGTWQLPEADVERLLRIRSRVEPFLRACLAEVPWDVYTFVGFTSVFQQNVASLALADRVKQHHPDLTVAFGGANWEDTMGVALLKAFPFVDLAFSGEADESFPAVLAARRAGEPLDEIAGVAMAGGPARPAPVGRVHDLDSVPVPDFSDYFEQKDRSEAAGLEAMLLMETARGCWWGERSHCTFCGLNGATMTFRSKSPDRVVAEFQHLRATYGARTFSVVDDILDMSFFRTVLPRLAAAHLGLDVFWEIKANLTLEQVRVLKEAGVTMVQPGVESLSDHVLKLMRKGTTTFRNVQLLKWCKEVGVEPFWNLLYGFPGETEEDYRETADHIAAIWHLDPPTACGPIRLDRFSPYHSDPAAFGMVNLRPMSPFGYLYPVGDEALMDISYYFEFDYAEPRTPEQHAREVIDLCGRWKASARRGDLEVTVRADGRLQLLDTRGDFARKPRRAVLEGWKAAVYVACDRGASLDRLREVEAVVAAGVPDAEVLTFVRHCVEHRLMIGTGKSWLSVATWRAGHRDLWAAPEPEEQERTELVLLPVGAVSAAPTPAAR